MRQVVIALVAIVALLAGFYLSARHFSEPIAVAQPDLNGNSLGSFRPDFQLANSTGELVTAADFAGKTVLINFWATWCNPCRKEMPILLDLQRDYGTSGLQVLGIALDDAQRVRTFIQTYGISYLILVGEADVFETSTAYGNTEGVLPYSVLVDKAGTVRWQYAGIIRHAEITKLLSEHL